MRSSSKVGLSLSKQMQLCFAACVFATFTTFALFASESAPATNSAVFHALKDTASIDSDQAVVLDAIRSNTLPEVLPHVWQTVRAYALNSVPEDYMAATVKNPWTFGKKFVSKEGEVWWPWNWHRKFLFVEYDDFYADFGEMGRRVRANLIAYQLLYGPQPSVTKQRTSRVGIPVAELETVVQRMSDGLYPWLAPRYSSIRHMQELFLNTTGTASESGIVFCVGKKHFDYALLAITTLQRVLNCTLPIEVHYAGELDLPLDMVTALNTLPNVKCVNLLSHFPNELDNFATWSLKPFSLLAASFRNVIFIDADVLFFKNPATAILKDSKIFKKYRQLFFHDRTIDRRWGAYSRWFRKAQPVLTPYAESLRFLNGLSRHELESGVVALDKGDPGILHSLIYACKMNSAQVRNETYSHVHGDKETFWMAMEMARVPFRFTPGYSGAVGYLDSEVEGLVCGNMFHSDEELEPFWWNGGILMMKHVRNDWFMRFEHVVNDLEKTKDKWVWETDTKPNCIRPVDPQREVSELKGRERQIGQLYIEMYKDLTKLGWKDYIGKYAEK